MFFSLMMQLENRILRQRTLLAALEDFPFDYCNLECFIMFVGTIVVLFGWSS
jgi:hypothetical protein